MGENAGAVRNPFTRPAFHFTRPISELTMQMDLVLLEGAFLYAASVTFEQQQSFSRQKSAKRNNSLLPKVMLRAVVLHHHQRKESLSLLLTR